ncbi:MAG: glycosyltransferase family 4 protein [Nostocoides sp.]
MCPYSFDVPGGVQFHVRDLAEHFLRQGHEVSVLAPGDDEGDSPAYVVPCGRAVPVPYNGSIARVNFGPVTTARVNRWLSENQFDVLHIHEPVTPSLSLLTLWSAEAPVVATFHTSMPKSRAMQAAYPLLRPSLEKILGRIAVSENARSTVTAHLGGDVIVIPNGVNTGTFRQAAPRPEWLGTAGAPTVAFLGRIEEPRKGLAVLTAAMELVLHRSPQTRLLVAGPGNAEAIGSHLPDSVAAATTFLGQIDEPAKASLLASVSAYVAPQTGGESFGIVLVEAMASGAPVIASDLDAFVRVLGRPSAGEVFSTGDPEALAGAIMRVLANPARAVELSRAGQERAARFDWHLVADDVMAVYETVLVAADHTMPSGVWSRLFRPGRAT